MVLLSVKNLFQYKLKALISFLGVGFSMTLILILFGVYDGFSFAVGEYILNSGADIWVMQEGSSEMVFAHSEIPLSFQEKLEDIGGVKRVSPLISEAVKARMGDSNETVYLVGYDTKTGLGGPVRVVEGVAKPRENEIVVDKVLASNRGLVLGDILVIKGKNFKIKGVSEGSNFMILQYCFVDIGEFYGLLERPFARYFLVEVGDKVLVPKVVKKIEGELGLAAFSSEEFSVLNKKQIIEGFLPIIAALVVVGFVIGVAIIGITVYTTTMEKKREYGVLKALGATNTHLYRIAFEQSIIISVMGYFFGLSFSFFSSRLIIYFFPEVVILIRRSSYMAFFFVAVVMSAISSYIPIRAISGIDPMEVFK